MHGRCEHRLLESQETTVQEQVTCLQQQVPGEKLGRSRDSLNVHALRTISFLVVYCMHAKPRRTFMHGRCEHRLLEGHVGLFQAQVTCLQQQVPGLKRWSTRSTVAFRDGTVSASADGGSSAAIPLRRLGVPPEADGR